MAWQLTHYKIVATYSIQRIDQLSPGHAVTHTSPSAWPEHQRFLVAFQELRTARTTKQQWYLESSSAFFQERQVKTEKIVVLNNIGVAFTDQRAEIGNEACLIICCRSLENGRKAPAIMNRYQKDTATIRVECSRFE